MTDTALDYWAAGGYIPKKKHSSPEKLQKKRQREAEKKRIVNAYHRLHSHLSKGEIRRMGRTTGYDNLLKQTT